MNVITYQLCATIFFINKIMINLCTYKHSFTERHPINIYREHHSLWAPELKHILN